MFESNKRKIGNFEEFGFYMDKLGNLVKGQGSLIIEELNAFAYLKKKDSGFSLATINISSCFTVFFSLVEKVSIEKCLQKHRLKTLVCVSTFSGCDEK